MEINGFCWVLVMDGGDFGKRQPQAAGKDYIPGIYCQLGVFFLSSPTFTKNTQELGVTS